jgi:hypothetical protein
MLHVACFSLHCTIGPGEARIADDLCLAPLANCKVNHVAPKDHYHCLGARV